MMRSRLLSTFTLLGVLLIVLGIIGKALGPRFIFDPGQIGDGNEAWYYMIVGALMVLNGLLAPALPADDRRPDAASKAKSPARSTEVRPLAATTVEQRTGENA